MVTVKGKREESKDYSDDDFFHKELYGEHFKTVVFPKLKLKKPKQQIKTVAYNKLPNWIEQTSKS
jgi:hypothetical protein